MSGETVLVTGARGFLGSRLAPRLSALGANVIGVARGPELPSDGGAWRACNVEDGAAVARLFEETRPAVVFHLASYVRGTRDAAAVLTTFHANLASTVYVLTEASKVGCRRVVLAASMEETPVEQPARFPYAIAKRAATEYARFFHTAFGLSVVAARIGMAYGPGQRDIAKLVPHVILSQLEGRAPRLASGGRRADWILVDDVVDAFIACMNVPDLEDPVVEIGTGLGTSVGEVATRITAITGGPPPEIGALPDRPNDRDVVANAADAARRIGWRAAVGLDDGLRRCVEWYRAERAAGRL
jgi:UDP-glucose 4-epimerase